MHLIGDELLAWIGLRRVHEGGVARRGAEYLDWGRKVPCYLPEVFDRLAEAGLTELFDRDCAGLRRVGCTPRGSDRYQELTAKRGLPVDPEQSSGDCSVPPDRPSFPLRPVRASPERAARPAGPPRDHTLARPDTRHGEEMT